MTQYLISDIKAGLEGKIHDQSLTKIQGNIYDKIDEAARNILLDFDLKETKTYVPLSTAVYPDVSTYIAPDGMKGESVLTVRKMDPTQRSSGNRFSKTSTEEILFSKDDYKFSVDFNNGIKRLQLNINDNSDYTFINDFDSLTANGTPSLGSGALEYTLDKHNYISSTGSIKIKLDKAGTSAAVTVSGMNKSDITDYESIFAWINLPYLNNNSTPITSIKVKLGNDFANYIAMTVTAPHDSNALKPGYNLLRFDTSSKTTTGSPDLTDITYIEYTFYYPAQADDIYVNIDQITARNGEMWEIGFYSTRLFKDSITGELKDKPTSDSDIILLEKETYNLLFYELAEIIAQELQGEDSDFDIKYWVNKNKVTRSRYGLRFPSETKKRQQVYYSPFKRR